MSGGDPDRRVAGLGQDQVVAAEHLVRLGERPVGDAPPPVPDVPTPVVPYGPPATGPATPESSAGVVLAPRTVAGTAGKWAIRLLLPLLVRAIFRAIFR